MCPSSSASANSDLKVSVRKRILQAREALSAGEWQRLSALVFQQFSANEKTLVPSAARSVALYFPIRGEVDTRSFFRHFRGLGFSCCFPKVLPAPEPHKLGFFEVTDFSELRTGAYGIAEPFVRPGAVSIVPDVVLVPGVAFTREGYRLGYGKGYYDHVIAHWSSQARGSRPLLIGLAYGFQLVDELPLEDHDEDMDFVITEQAVLSTGGVR